MFSFLSHVQVLDVSTMTATYAYHYSQVPQLALFQCIIRLQQRFSGSLVLPYQAQPLSFFPYITADPVTSQDRNTHMHKLFHNSREVETRKVQDK